MSKVLGEVRGKGILIGYSAHCPGCDRAHVIYTGQFQDTGNSVWQFNGDAEKPTFSPSLLVKFGEGKVCHSFIRNGQWQFLNDCTHHLAGKTVNMLTDD